MMEVVVLLPAWRLQFRRIFLPDDRRTSACHASGAKSMIGQNTGSNPNGDQAFVRYSACKELIEQFAYGLPHLADALSEYVR